MEREREMRAGQRSIPQMRWQTLVPPGEYHAALVSSWFRPRTALHTHDFFEMMYVLTGTGIHEINDCALPLAAGDLLFIRPRDRHAIAVRPGNDLHFVNIAFPADAWAAFCVLSGLTDDAFSSQSIAPAPAVRVPVERRDECAQVFQRALRAFHAAPSRLELCRFWALAVPILLRPVEPPEEDDSALPTWLRAACEAMRDERNLRLGLTRFIALSGVSPAHLSRTLKAHRQQTPTAFINELRVQQAALLLTTTTEEIIEIAAACGFANLSYFYRRFVERFGMSPRAFRLRARHAVVP
jgi:AraC-like DNA-binding protein/quercetin dioxygenase-like cupin family protein